jgi:predicted amidophosphoribosyltransferase
MLENIVQCKFCKRPFQRVSGNICSNCLSDIEIDFVTLRNYLYDHQDINSVELLVKETGVKKNIIIHLLREKRFSIYDPSGNGLTCESCHKPLDTGRICDDCKNVLASSIVSNPIVETADDKLKKPRRY